MKKNILALGLLTASLAVWGQAPLSSESIGSMVYVPAGSYHRDRKPENINSVSAFYIAAREITQEQFVLVTGLKNPSKKKVKGGPVESVSFYQAAYFCNKLSLMEGLRPVYSIKGSTDPAAWGKIPKKWDYEWSTLAADWEADGYRLPTVAEWQWAALGGAERTFTFFSGASVGPVQDMAWYLENSGGAIHPVGEKRPNELGLYDMSGNVDEMCWAQSDPTLQGPLDDPKGDPRSNGLSRSVCGGSYRSPLQDLWLLSDVFYWPDGRWIDAGFRVVRGGGLFED